MNRLYSFLFFFLFVPVFLSAQTIKFSDYDREDTRDINFEIIGKLSNKILVYKNNGNNHKVSIYDNEMNTLETVKLDFVPDRTFNMDFVVYPDFFYMIYQYQKGRILHCMVVKMDGDVKKMSEPVEVDTTQIPVMADNKIYSTISSEDKQKIMIFKVQSRYQKISIATLLFDKQLNLLHKSRLVSEYDGRNEKYDNFSVDNEGNFAFTFDKQTGYRDNSNILNLVIKAAVQDSFYYQNIDLSKNYIDEVKLKIDNLNNRYILNTFYYKKNRGNIEGLFTYVWDKQKAGTYSSRFIEFYDSLRAEAKWGGMLRYAFDNFFIRQIIVKKDGGFIITAEDFTSENRDYNNSWNRYNYLYNPSYLSSGSYYYNPYNNYYYRPLSSFNRQNTMYYYQNILVMSISKNGETEWSKIIPKDQFDNNDDNFLSFSTMNAGGEVHFLFNTNTKNQIISDQSIAPDGTIKRNPTLKTQERGYEFMPRLTKQIGSNQVIIPCTYRNNICFAKVDF